MEIFWDCHRPSASAVQLTHGAPAQHFAIVTDMSIGTPRKPNSDQKEATSNPSFLDSGNTWREIWKKK